MRHRALIRMLCRPARSPHNASNRFPPGPQARRSSPHGREVPGGVQPDWRIPGLTLRADAPAAGPGVRPVNWDDRDIIAFKHRIGGHQRQPFRLGLSDQDAIEWIAMMWRECGDGECVGGRDRESMNLVQPQALRDIDCRGFGKWKLADSVFDRDLPSARGGKVSLGRALGDDLQKIIAEASAVGLQPEPAVCIDEKLHVPSSERETGTTSWKASSGIRSSASFELAQQLFIEWSIEIVGDDETSFVDTKHRAVLLDRHKTDHGSSRSGDDDLFSGGGPPQQPERWAFAS